MHEISQTEAKTASPSLTPAQRDAQRAAGIPYAAEGIEPVRERGRFPVPSWIKVGAHATRMFALIFALGLLSTSCIGPAGMVRADAIQPAVDRVTERHDAMLRGELDPKSISPEDRDTFLRTSELLRGTVDEAAAQKK